MMFNSPHPQAFSGGEWRSDNFRAALHFKITNAILVKVITLNQQRTTKVTYSNTSTL